MWEPWSPEAVAKLRAEGRIVYVDFTARWCATCQTNKKLVFASDEVLRLFAERKIATLRADWTNKDPRITAELAAYGRSAVPLTFLRMRQRRSCASLCFFTVVIVRRPAGLAAWQNFLIEPSCLPCG